MRIETANEPHHWAIARTLVEEYVEWLGIDLSYQNYEEEISGLEQMYAPPGGVFLLAVEEEAFAGCVALRDKGAGRCEMKRLYIRPAFRGQGLGFLLSKICVDQARKMGYQQMVLDTLPEMKSAIRIYKKLGFKEIPPYYHNPVPNVIFLGCDL